MDAKKTSKAKKRGRPSKEDIARSIEAEKRKKRQRNREEGAFHDAIGRGGTDLDPDGLSLKERLFVDRFLIHGSRNRAAVEAGIPYSSSLVCYQREGVQAVLKREIAERTAKYRLDSHNVLKQLGFIVNADAGTLYNRDGSPKGINELDEASRAIIAGLDVEDQYGWEEDATTGKRKRVYTGSILKYRHHSKTEGLSLAMRFLKLLDGGGSGGKDRLSEVIGAMRAGPVEPKQLPKAIEGEVKE